MAEQISQLEISEEQKDERSIDMDSQNIDLSVEVTRRAIQGLRIEIIWLDPAEFDKVVKDFQHYQRKMYANINLIYFVETLGQHPGEWFRIKDFNLDDKAIAKLCEEFDWFNQSLSHRAKLALEIKFNEDRNSNELLVRLTFIEQREQKVRVTPLYETLIVPYEFDRFEFNEIKRI